MNTGIDRMRIADTIAPKLREAYEREQEFQSLVDAAKSGALAADIAREVLDVAERKKRRKIHLYDTKTGEVVRDVTPVEVAIGAARRGEVEFGVVEGAVQQTVCAGWEGRCPDKAKPPGWAFYPSHVANRGGGPWICKQCHMRKLKGVLTPKRRSQIAKARYDSMSEGCRADLHRAGGSGMRAERAECARKATATLTPQQCRDRSLKAWATRRAKAGK